MFTHSDSCWSHSQGGVETKTKDYHQKLNFWVTSLKILGNEELLKLFAWVFTDLMIREFELLTSGFELVTRGFELVTRIFAPVNRGLELAFLNFNSGF